MTGLTFEQISIGVSAQTARTISESDVYLFAGITGDMNPAHINAEYAGRTAFKKRIAHGILVCGLISKVLGEQLPGNGTIYVSQSVKFKAPVYFGDTIIAKVEVTEKLEEKKLVLLKTTCVNQEGTIVIDGEAMVSPPRPPKV